MTQPYFEIYSKLKRERERGGGGREREREREREKCPHASENTYALHT